MGPPHEPRRRRVAWGEEERRGEGYEARDDEKQEKAPVLICAGASTSARSAGSFRGQPPALLWTAKNAIDAVSTQKGKKRPLFAALP